MKTRRTVTVAAVTLAFAMGRGAQALDYLCELNGAAEFAPGLSASTTPLDPPLDFAFNGELTNCLGDPVDGYHLCAVGKLNLPSCLGNQTEGDRFVICPNTCTTLGGTAACDAGVTPVIDSFFSGACAGTICAGANPNDKAFYIVSFDQATVTAALAACNPVMPGPPLTSGSFNGFEGRLQSLNGLPPAP